MGVTHEEDAAPSHDGATEPVTQVVVGSVSDACANCGAPLASDQRYCVNCGQRRGKSRFAVANESEPPPPTLTRVAATSSEPPSRRPSYGATVIAGVATLLIALGVGVEIGRLSNQHNAGSGRAQVITLNGSGASAGSNTTAAGNTGSAGSAGSAGSTGHHKAHKAAAPAPKTEVIRAQQAAKAAKPTTQAVQKASNAASSVLGGSGAQGNATESTGSQCAAGTPGCQNGKFTGGFFSGGQ